MSEQQDLEATQNSASFVADSQGPSSTFSAAGSFNRGGGSSNNNTQNNNNSNAIDQTFSSDLQQRNRQQEGENHPQLQINTKRENEQSPDVQYGVASGYDPATSPINPNSPSNKFSRTESQKWSREQKKEGEKEEEEESRPDIRITMNNPEANAEFEYPDNYIKTYKYEWWNFLFLNLYYQLKKVSNFFFLVNAVYALVPGVSPFAPIVSIAPLLFVLGVAMIKDGFEDWGRHRADGRANSVEATVVRKHEKKDGGDGSYKLTKVESRHVQVGDIMRIRNGEEIRADVLLLSSTGAESSSFIDTCNLDGETNLKGRKAVPETWKINSVKNAVGRKLEIQTTAPSPHLHHWGGVLRIDGTQEVSLGLDQFLYRSAVLKNTKTAWGVVLYAGVDTKMFRNLEDRPPKMSGLDIKLNWLIFAVVIVQHIILFLQAGLAVAFTQTDNNAHWYARHYMNQNSQGATFGFRYLGYFILMSYMIPISLFVTIELCKVAQAKLMEWDNHMFEFMSGKWQHCTANTSNLNEQLSQVKFIFSDKTGTLTENVMKFKLGDALGLPICADDWSTSLNYMHDERMQRYMRALALCHTVQPFPLKEDDNLHEGEEGNDNDNNSKNKKKKKKNINNNVTAGGEKQEDENEEEEEEEEENEEILQLKGEQEGEEVHDPTMPLKYDGPSPDEMALVDTAKQHGIELRQRFTRSIRLFNHETKKLLSYDILATLEFTPDRKMMSIVVRDAETGKIVLFTKGADSNVEKQLHPQKNKNFLAAAKERLKEMADTGLRTLLVCYREIEQIEFDSWNERFLEAGKALKNRSALVDEVCLELERDLIMCGLTAIEDKLQDQVPETIQFFLKAGVVIWMLTGDKRETALTIADTSSLAKKATDIIEHIDIGGRKIEDPEASKIVLAQLNDTLKQIEHEEAKDKKKKDSSNNNNNHQEDTLSVSGRPRRSITFVIDGPALAVAMRDHNPLFVNISQRVNSAVCCRLTPLQKANVVKMFQQTTGTTALAIGDGANDVSMISEGRVGVGIVGLEGAQAALAADYAIPRFKHLRRLLAVHGRFALLRNSLCILFSFYKNFVIATTLALYSFHNGLSGGSIYDGWLLTFYNIIFTSLPPWVVGMFEKDAPELRLMQLPHLYAQLSAESPIYFGSKALAGWFSEAVFHGIIVFYMMYLTLLQQDYHSSGGGGGGTVADVFTVSSTMNSMIIFLVLYKLMLHIRYWQVLTILSFALSLVVYFGFVAVTGSFENQDGATVLYNFSQHIWGDVKNWAFVCFGCFGLTIFDLAGVTADRAILNSDSELNLAETPQEASASTGLHGAGMMSELVANNNNEGENQEGGNKRDEEMNRQIGQDQVGESPQVPPPPPSAAFTHSSSGDARRYSPPATTSPSFGQVHNNSNNNNTHHPDNNNNANNGDEMMSFVRPTKASASSS